MAFPENVVFDLDGTLVDSFTGIECSLGYAFRTLQLPAPIIDRSRVGISLKQLLLEIAPNESLETRRRLEQEFRSHYDQTGYSMSVSFPGVERLLRRLTMSRRRAYLCTMKPTLSAKGIVQLLGWTGFFYGILGSDSLDVGEPTKEALLRRLLEMNKLRKVDSAYVGDYPTDVLAARANGICSIAVTYGYGSYHELCAVSPDFICKNVEDLSLLLQNNRRIAQKCE